MDISISCMINFSDGNWIIWKSKWNISFVVKDLYTSLEGDIPKPKDMYVGSGRNLTARLSGLFNNCWMIVFFIMFPSKFRHVLFFMKERPRAPMHY